MSLGPHRYWVHTRIPPWFVGFSSVRQGQSSGKGHSHVLPGEYCPIGTRNRNAKSEYFYVWYEHRAYAVMRVSFVFCLRAFPPLLNERFAIVRRFLGSTAHGRLRSSTYSVKRQDGPGWPPPFSHCTLLCEDEITNSLASRPIEVTKENSAVWANTGDTQSDCINAQYF